MTGSTGADRLLNGSVRAEAERARLVETLRLAMDVGEQGTWEWDPATDGIVLSDRAGEIATKADATLSPAELAAYTTTAAVLLNLDRVITRD